MEKQNTSGPKAEGVVCLHSRADTDAYSTTSPRRKPILRARVSHHEHLIKALPADLVDMDVARDAVRVAWTWRNEHDVRRRTSSSFIPDRQIDRVEADRLFNQLFPQRIGLGGAK